jgi:hypothetical protein
MKRFSRLTWSLVVVAVVASAASIGALAHGGDTAKIHGCVVKYVKFVRIVGANENCFSGETALDWNVQGAPGLPGATGPQGPTGATGPAGPGGALGFGYVAESGDVIESRSSAGAGDGGAWDVARIGNDEPFSYCIRGPVGFKVVLVLPVNQPNLQTIDDYLIAPSIQHTPGVDQVGCENINGTQSVRVAFPDDDAFQDYVSNAFEIVFF